MNTIHNAPEFRAYILQLIDDHSDSTRSLKDYLLALLQRIQSAKDDSPSYQDVANFLSDSYTSDLAAYSKEWEALPLLTTTPNSEAYHQEIRTFAYQERHLKIKITGLHKLSENGALRKDPNKLWLNGADDYRGTRWYNLTVSSFLERGTTLFEGIEVGEENYESFDGWIDFGFILSDGASYE